MQRLLPPPLVRMTQFYMQKDDLTRFTGSCGQTALAVCIAAANGTPDTFEGVGELMIAITRAMIAKGLAAPNGAAWLTGYAQEARDRGQTIVLERPYEEPLSGWEALLEEHAGVRPILLQIARGAELVDSVTGSRDEANLRYHAIAVVGCDDDGYLCIDGDNPQATRRILHYRHEVMMAARPCGMLVLGMQRNLP